MYRIRNKYKFIISIVLLLGLALLLILRGKREEEHGEGVFWKDGKERLTAFLKQLPASEMQSLEQRMQEREEQRLSYDDFMKLAELFAEQKLIKGEALFSLEQKLSVWSKEEDYVDEETLSEYYVLLAEHSLIPENIGCYDVFWFGEKGEQPDYSSMETSEGVLYAKQKFEKLKKGYSYSVILEGNLVTEVLGYANGKVTLSNAWLIEAEDNKLTVFYKGITALLLLERPLAMKLSGLVADITVSGEYVAGLAVKNNVITAKVLRTDKNGVELEGYGMLPFEEDFKIYKIYEELEEEQTASILVGYTSASFAVSGNKISAALITEPVQITNIRVLIQNSSYGGYFHESLQVSSECRFYVSDSSGSMTWHEAGETVVITKEEVGAAAGRLYIGTEKESGRLKLLNVKRAVGTPSYRGTMEVALFDGGLILINELSMEEYLYGVLPSEMPSSFGMEALKAQAVCARSYACNQLMANRFRQYGAHVDDSMVSQVYMNYGENEDAIFAVKDTFGKIMTYEGKCITAYYFSCSYGHTSDSADVWGTESGTGYLSGSCQTTEGGRLELKTEKEFESFFYSDRNWYDAQAVWFRWKTIMEAGMEEILYERLKERYTAVPDMVLTKKTEKDGTEHYVSEAIEPLGKLEDIVILERGNSGIVTKLLLIGSNKTYLIQKEYNIRTVLASLTTITLADGSTSSNMPLLPSAYIRISKQEDGFLIEGGGYGHGVGMSQYGAKAMAAQGNTFEKILGHFYPGTELTYLYQ